MNLDTLWLLLLFDQLCQELSINFFTIFSRHERYENTRGIPDSVLVDWSPVAERSWSLSKSVNSFRKQNGWIKNNIIQGVPKKVTKWLDKK